MRIKSMFILLMIAVLMSSSLWAGFYRYMGLSGIAPDAEIDPFMLNPSLIHRIDGMRVIINPSVSYSSHTYVDDEYASSYSVPTNNLQTSKDTFFNLTGTTFGFILSKANLGIALLMSPNYSSLVQRIISDPNDKTNNQADTESETLIKNSGLYDGSLLLSYNIGKVALNFGGSYQRGWSTNSFNFKTNGLIKPSSYSRSFSSTPKLTGSLGFLLSDDVKYSLGAVFNYSTRGGTSDQNTIGWFTNVFMVNNFVAASNKSYVTSTFSGFRLGTVLFADIKMGDIGLLRLTGNGGYESQLETFEKSSMFLATFGRTNLLASILRKTVDPALSLSYLKNYDRTLLGMGLNLSLENQSELLDFNLDTSTNPVAQNQQYTELDVNSQFDFDTVFSVETSATPWLTVRGSILPTLFSYTSDSFVKTDAITNATGGSKIVKQRSGSQFKILPEIDFISGLTFKLGKNITLDLLATLGVITISYDKKTEALSEEQPLIDSTKKSPIDTTANLNFALYAGLTIRI